MGEEYKAKIFKSGNSLALRLPKALGLQEGEEMTLVPHDDGSFSFWRQDRAREVLMGLYGSMSAGFMADGRDDTAQAERDWSRDATQAA
ncbi:AbrB/MazE/SpoVT family DNA-binding domain-containing protein [Sphingobium abikonense]|uniref:AbrB/MazE/SpoVT family DNA-binding domain-containing protein n=1 Tax=Sphingobium abikonense TaxID=86193 RepID=UPI0007895C58|nr:AbrB/MazE/SpoVT family DNA-binding domain-containing protein [Sphingobium abikonense]